MLHLLHWTHQGNIRFRAKLSALNVFKLLQSLFVLSLQVAPGYRHWPNVNFDVHEVPHEKFDVGQIWRSWRSGIGYPRPNHRSGNVDTCLRIRGDAKSCWKSMFRFPSSGWDIKRYSNFSFLLKKKRPHCLSQIRPPPPKKNIFCLFVMCFTCIRIFNISKKQNIPLSLEYICNWNVDCCGELGHTHVAPCHIVWCAAILIAENKSISDFPHTAVVYSSHGYATSRLLSTSLASLSKKNYCFRTSTLSARVLRLTDASCVHKRFVTLSGKFEVGGFLLSVSLNSRWSSATDCTYWISKHRISLTEE